MSWYRMKRGWMDHEFFQKEPFSERDAWQWMIEEAQWKGATASVLGKPIPLKRGQLSASVRFMSQKFQWSTNRVLRFLNRLQEWSMAETQTETGQTIITICNYSKYQDVDNKGSNTNGNTHGDTSGDGVGDKLEEDNKPKKRNKKNISATALVKPETVSEEVWRDFKKQRKTPITPTALAGIEREVAKAGMTLEEGLRMAVERGWQGFKAEWVKDNGHETNRKNIRKSKSDELDDILAEYRVDQGIAVSGGENSNSRNVASVLRPVQHLRKGPESLEIHASNVRGLAGPVPNGEDFGSVQGAFENKIHDADAL